MIDTIAKKNQLRYEIRQKKQSLSKMIRHPEFIDETHTLEKEIQELETELQELQ